MQTNTRHKGFTLLELLVVIAIIAALTAVAVPTYNYFVRKSQASEILLKYDALRLGIQTDIATTGEISNCAEIVTNNGGANLGEDYANLTLGFEAVSGGNLQGYRPVFTVCASIDMQGELSVGVAKALYDEFLLTNTVEEGAVITDSIVSFAVPLTDNDEAACHVPVGNTLTPCGAPVAVPTPATIATPAQITQSPVVAPTPTTQSAPVRVPMVARIERMTDITGATALSAYSGQAQGVPVGTRVVGLYMAGSTVNELAGVDPAQLPSVSNGYTRVADAGYQYLDQSGALGRLMPGQAQAGNLRPLAPSERNAWDGGIVVFSDGSVGRMQKAANGNGSEKDYIYFSVLAGVNAQQGMSIIHGTAQPGQSVQVMDGGSVIGTVTADNAGNWNFAGAASLSEPGHTVSASPTNN